MAGDFMRSRVTMALAFCLAAGTPALGGEPFRFEDLVELEEMRGLLQRGFSSASSREYVREKFVTQGGATLIAHPKRDDVEKYIYDINICSYYIWRWNISADYSSDGRLNQIYMNGEPVLGDVKSVKAPSGGKVYQIARERPEAFKGESTLMAMISDADRNPSTTHDQWLIGGFGPTRADPLDMGKIHPYKGEVWRTIFDPDPAQTIVPYRGDCSAADARVAQLKAESASTASADEATPPPATMDDAGVRAWLSDHIDTDGWTLITADGAAVVLGSPKGVSQHRDGLLSTEIRHEYYRPFQLGGLDSRSNLQSWDVDCKGQRIRIQKMTVFAGNNMSGASVTRNWQKGDWVAVAANETRARTVARICDAPATGQRLNR